MMCIFSFALYASVFNVVVMRIAKITELYLFHTSSQRLFILRRQVFIPPLGPMFVVMYPILVYLFASPEGFLVYWLMRVYVIP